MEVALTKLSSKGQVVIPASMRRTLNAGDRLLIIQTDDQLILKKATTLNKKIAEDIEFAHRTEEAWKRYERGEFKSMDSRDFLKEIEKW